VRIYRYDELVQTRTVTGTSHTERGPEDAGLLWGMYTVKVAAVNANGDASEDAETGLLTVGLTGKLEAAPLTAGGIGNMTLTWQQPAADPDPPQTVFYARVRGSDWIECCIAQQALHCSKPGTLKMAAGTCCCYHRLTPAINATCRSTTLRAPPFSLSASRWRAPPATALLRRRLSRRFPCRLESTR